MNELTHLLYRQLSLYPGMEPVDCIKLLEEHAMGERRTCDARQDAQEPACGLALPGLAFDPAGRPEPIGNGLCRVHLAGLPLGITAPTLAALCATAPMPTGREAAFREALAWLRGMGERGELPYPVAMVTETVDRYLAAGCPPASHSARFRSLYRPRYRLMDAHGAALLPVFAATDAAMAAKSHVLVGIDGMSGAGKSTLAARMQAVYHCGVVHADDFFLRPEQRTAQRLTEPGGNIDYERLAPVAQQAADDRPFRYQAFDCRAGAMGAWRELPGGPLTVLEGVYSLHPRVEATCDVRVFLALDTEAQMLRVARRAPELAERFYQEWIPMENRYFSAFAIREGCDLILNTA